MAAKQGHTLVCFNEETGSRAPGVPNPRPTASRRFFLAASGAIG
jgi:hypothetical protein